MDSGSGGPVTSLYLAASPMAYLLSCAALQIRALRRNSIYAIELERGAWRITALVEFRRFTFGACVMQRIRLADFHLGFILVVISHDAYKAKSLAQSKADAKAVESLLASLPKSAAK